jgi:hypothetical protein
MRSAGYGARQSRYAGRVEKNRRRLGIEEHEVIGRCSVEAGVDPDAVVGVHAAGLDVEHELRPGLLEDTHVQLVAVLHAPEARRRRVAADVEHASSGHPATGSATRCAGPAAQHT